MVKYSENIDQLSLTFGALADPTRRAILSKLSKGEASVTPEIAILFESILKIPTSFWIKKQSNYDRYKTKKIIKNK